MKKIQKERKSFYDVFVAIDGTEFNDREQCEKYEQSAKGVIMAKIRSLIIQQANEGSIFGLGCCDSMVWVMKPKTQDDADAILQFYLLHNADLTNGEHNGMLERARKLVQRALDENDIIFVGRGCCDDDCWFYGTRNSLKDSLDKFIPSEENS